MKKSDGFESRAFFVPPSKSRSKKINHLDFRPDLKSSQKAGLSRARGLFQQYRSLAAIDIKPETSPHAPPWPAKGSIGQALRQHNLRDMLAGLTILAGAIVRSWKVLNWFWQSLGSITLVVGYVVSFGLPAWAVQASKLFAAHQPVSSVAAGLLGSLFFAVITRLLAASREALVAAGVKDRFYRDGDRVNPLDRMFERKRLSIADLAPPMGGNITNKTFDNCELIGPANIVLAASGGGVLHGNTFIKCDAVSTAEGARPETATGFFNCRFINCHFFNVTLFFHEGVYSTANATISGLNWVTPAPAGAVSSEATTDKISEQNVPEIEPG